MTKSVRRFVAIAACVLATSFAVASGHSAELTGANSRPIMTLSKSKQVAPSAKGPQSRRSRLMDQKGVKALSPQPFPPDPSDIRRSKSNANSLSPKPLPPDPVKSGR